MDTFCIEKIVRKASLKTKFMGCFASDTLIVPTEYPSFLITNTDCNHMNGTHWVCIYFPRFNSVEYFCSLGVPFYSYPLICNYIRNIVGFDNVYFNLKHIQSELSNTCGFHAIAFAIKRDLGISFNNIINNFTLNECLNDLIVVDYMLPLTKNMKCVNLDTIIGQCCKPGYKFCIA